MFRFVIYKGCFGGIEQGLNLEGLKSEFVFIRRMSEQYLGKFIIFALHSHGFILLLFYGRNN